MLLATLTLPQKGRPELLPAKLRLPWVGIDMKRGEAADSMRCCMLGVVSGDSIHQKLGMQVVDKVTGLSVSA